MTEGQWACSIDLTDTYFHIPIHHSFKKFLRFSILRETYQFKALPFGLAIAPRIFTMVTLEVAKILRQHGIAIHVHLDDWLVRNNDFLSISSQTQDTLELCEDLGLLINLPKSQLDPRQIIDFVGVLYDLSIGRAFPPLKRVEKIQTSSITENSCLRLVKTDRSPGISRRPGTTRFFRLHICPLQFHLASLWKLTINCYQNW